MPDRIDFGDLLEHAGSIGPDSGLVLELGKGASWVIEDGKPSIRMVWALSVAKARTTNAGRPGKPTHVATFVDEDPAKLLRDLTDRLEAGDVVEVTR